MKVSIICVYNNPEQLNQCLISSLKKQNIDYELILVNGSNGDFKSCAKALNHGVNQSTGQILVFSHQDIILKRDSELSLFTNYISSMPVGTIIGVAGAQEKNKQNLGNYTSGNNVSHQLKFTISEAIQVSCVDECFFGMLRETYNKHPFNEYLCDDWHLYAVEQCLFHRKEGNKVMLYPSQIHHLSSGKISLKYMEGLVKLVDQYSSDFKYIWTTCYKIRANCCTVRFLKMLWYLNRKIHRRSV